MKRLNANETLDAPLRGGVIALGNFDGFHKGHQAVVARAVALAKERGVPALIGTFTPHPARYFRPETPPFRLTTMAQRLTLFEQAGVDATLIFDFAKGVAEATPDAFVGDWLSARAGVCMAVTGEDFTFGKGRVGRVDDLKRIGAAYGIDSEAVRAVADDEGVISSTRIRNALRAGQAEVATRLLTRPYTIAGKVTHGDKLGRTIGFPTANVLLADYLRPAYGIYAVRCHLADGRVVDGAANLGVRPMFDPPKELLEVHLFDFSSDLYGQQIAVELRHFLRPEAKFDGLKALVEQMERDCARAKALLSAE